MNARLGPDISIAYIKISPPIGIARLGDSGFDLDFGETDGSIEWFLPSEIPGTFGLPDSLNGQFRDQYGRIKRQAVRFRVYAYDANHQIIGEVTQKDGFYLHWTVHVANAKGSYTEFKGQYEEPTQCLRNPDVQPDLAPEDRNTLIVDAGIQCIRGRSLDYAPLVGHFYGSQENPTTVSLGGLLTDDAGRLIFIGGAGYSRCVGNPTVPHFQPDIISEFDSIDWVDDTCDGWVDVTVRRVRWPPNWRRLHIQQWQAQDKASIVSAPPKFAWGVRPPTTLFDVMENLYHEKTGWKDHYSSQFYQDIWPVLYGTYAVSWLNEKGFQGHGPLGQGNFVPLEAKLKSTEGKSLREHIFNRIRQPEFANRTQASTKYMPRLSGDGGDAIEPGSPLPINQVPIESFAALTRLQYSRFSEWAKGSISLNTAPWDEYKKFEDVPIHMQPSFLTRAALENTIGDPLYPGIEMYWNAKVPDTYTIRPEGAGFFPVSLSFSPPERPTFSWKLRNFDPPFRINHRKVKPGELCRGLSLPWQSDFDQCNTHWWPSARPDDVISLRDWKRATSGRRTISEEEFTRSVAGRRKKWTRGLRDTPDFPAEYFPGSTDMVKAWQDLGFVTRRDEFSIGSDTATMPIWLESERHNMRSVLVDRAIFQLPPRI